MACAIGAQYEMQMPILPKRVEERREFSSKRIRGIDPGRLMKVATRADKGQICDVGGPAGAFGMNVIDMKPRGLAKLQNQAIPAAAAVSVPHLRL
jgi:hypothetical protein